MRITIPRELIGEWRVVDLIARGRHDSGASFQGMRFKFTKSTMTTIRGETTPAGLRKKPPLSQKYSVDNSRDPKHLNMVFEGKELSLTMKAIYKIEDGKLYICMGGVDRPATFDTANTKRGCYVAERVSVADTKPIDSGEPADTKSPSRGC